MDLSSSSVGLESSYPLDSMVADGRGWGRFILEKG